MPFVVSKVVASLLHIYDNDNALNGSASAWSAFAEYHA